MLQDVDEIHQAAWNATIEGRLNKSARTQRPMTICMVFNVTFASESTYSVRDTSSAKSE